MKTKVFIIITAVLLPMFVNGQASTTSEQLAIQKRKVDTLFSPNERANLQYWFYKQTKSLNLSAAVESEYNRIISKNAYEMGRLNDKDKNFSNEELHQNFDKLISKTNAEVKQILSTEQYIDHLESFGSIMRRIYRKMNWSN